MRSTTGGQHSFAKIPSANIQRSMFNRSCGHKLTFNSADLVPVFIDEALPGDTFNLTMSNVVRLSTPIVPIMDNMKLDSFFFAVPMRLIWENWARFMGEQDNPGDSTSFVIPTAETAASGGALFNSLDDYMGIPPGIESLEYSNMFHRAYNLIWKEWFRDENLQVSPVVDIDDGPDDPADYQLLKRGKRHDYFTSALPWPQKGPAVGLPLGISAPVVSTGDGIPLFNLDGNLGRKMEAAETTAGDHMRVDPTIAGSGWNTMFWDETKLETDLTGATVATINQLRQAIQIQKLYERDARGGTRLTEIVRSHFGVVSPDARLQRPEFLGGGTQTINITAVPMTNSTYENPPGTIQGTPQGNLAAYGVSASSNHSFAKSFTEHCIVIGMVCVRADLNYQQGLERMFSRETRWDFYWPALAQIGEQSIFNREIYATGLAGDADVFGYQERYAEYRYKPSRVSGTMRSTHPQSVDIWHLAQHFTSLPVLGSDFIEEQPPIDRIVAISDEPEFKGDFFFSFKCARPMPTYGVPGNMDRF